MPIEVKVELKGFDKITSPANLQAANELLTEDVMLDTSGDVPVDTGNLRDSAHLSGPDEFTYDAEYAGYVYNGTSKMGARPWFEDSKAMNLGYWEQAAAEFILGESQW